MNLSSTDVALFVISVPIFMLFHGWFFFATTVAGDRKAREEQDEADLLARLEAVRAGKLIELDDARRARSAVREPLLDGRDDRDREVDP